MKRILILNVVLLSFHQGISGQHFRLEDFGKDRWLRYQGRVSAMGLWYDGGAPRDPFSYMITGSLNFTFAGIYHLPLAFAYSDQEFRMPSPVKLNRFSLHPSYKGLRLHLGDAAMSFTPYTLNGHQFTGAGLEWQTEKHWSIALMYGRLLKSKAYNAEEPSGVPVLKRKGYGLQLGYDRGTWQLKGNVFSAADLLPKGISGDLLNYPFPEHNLVIGLQGRFPTPGKGTLMFDLANSQITVKSDELKKYGISQENDSLSLAAPSGFKAMKFNLAYPAFHGNLSLIYERIDPGYRTFGAYYFNADLENISASVTQSLFSGKVHLSLRSGIQRDNLDKAKKQELQRHVHAVSLQVNAGKRLSMQGAYSNFRSFTNSRNQFDKINQVNELEMPDTLNYRQLSAQASLSMNYRLEGDEGNTRSVSFYSGYQENRNEGGTGAIPEDRNQFLQGNLSYHSRLASSGWSYTVNCNSALNLSSQDTYFIWGPGLDLGKHFFSEKLRTAVSFSYNSSKSRSETNTRVFNTRINGTYQIHPDHAFRISGLFQHRDPGAMRSHDLTLQIYYQYTFDNLRIHLDPKSGVRDQTPVRVSFRYRNVSYSGTLPEVNRQIALVSQMPQFKKLPPTVQHDLEVLRQRYLEQEKRAGYKIHALNYLKVLYDYGDILMDYYTYADKTIRKIIHDMKRTDRELERRYVTSYHAFHDREEEREWVHDPKAVLEECTRRLKAHRWLEREFNTYTGIGLDRKNPPMIRTYMDAHLGRYFKTISKNTSPENIMEVMETSLIDHFYRWSLKYTPDQKVELRYPPEN
ncbi:TonB-dependent receptor [Robertkochia flava]|uniref:hypothetical protein n=1 Tax=Robertkochia flava TaxID=3447986 RepID=UPI001CCE9ECF|nr:hypothetical protein [Robertkochia marina]